MTSSTNTNEPARPSLRISLSALVLSCAVSLLLGGCARPPYTWAADIPAERAKPAAERTDIQPGDVVSINVVAQPALTATHTVGADGTVSLPNVGTVLLGGKSVPSAEASLKKQLSLILADPKVAIIVVTRSIEVTIMGEVGSTGKFQLKSGDGVATALAMAGGIGEFGDEDSVFLIRPSEPIRIRFRLEDLLQGGKSARSFALRDGDLIVVE